MTSNEGQLKPHVSVLISTYNRKRYLPVAVRSVLDQDFQDFELIIVRDGGKPVADALAQFEDPRIRLIDREENRGVAASFNEAIASAKGQYITYLGDDDLWYPNHLSILVRALEENPSYGAAYTDLYKAHCIVREDGSREVLSKNLEISRDFDRLLMFQFNHALHVSLMHRKDIFVQAGGYNESLRVLIDWDLTRKLVFYTDFLHVPTVTGEYYAPICDSDRISVVQRRNTKSFERNVLAIRSTRPPKPWPKVQDLAVTVLADALDAQTQKTIENIWRYSFYPHRIYLPASMSELQNFQTPAANVLGVGIEKNEGLKQHIETILAADDSPFHALVSGDCIFAEQEDVWLEKPLHALMLSTDPLEVFCMSQPPEGGFAYVFRREQIVRLCRMMEANDSDLAKPMKQAGFCVRPPQMHEYPFAFDLRLALAQQMAEQGRWSELQEIYSQMAHRFGNTLWMKTLAAAAQYNNGEYESALAQVQALQAQRPTIAGEILEGKCLRALGEYTRAMECFREVLNKLNAAKNASETRLEVIQ